MTLTTLDFSTMQEYDFKVTCEMVYQGENCTYEASWIMGVTYPCGCSGIVYFCQRCKEELKRQWDTLYRTKCLRCGNTSSYCYKDIVHNILKI